MENEQPSLSEIGERVRHDFELLRDGLRRETAELRISAEQFVHQHPWYAAGAAFGVGFLLSGGLFSRATARTVSFGTRFFLGRVLRQLIAGAGLGLVMPSEIPPSHSTERH